MFKLTQLKQKCSSLKFGRTISRKFGLFCALAATLGEKGCYRGTLIVHVAGSIEKPICKAD